MRATVVALALVPAPTLALSPVCPGVDWLEARPRRALARTNAYVLHGGSGGVAAVVEPTCEGDEELAWWVSWFKDHGCPPIILTHHHFDHTGQVDLIQDATGCEIWAPPKGPPSRLTLHQFQHYEVTRVLREGDDAGGWNVWETPGHEDAHVVLHKDGIMVSGDALSAGEGPMQAWWDSLRRITSLDPEVVLSSHREPVRKGAG